MSGLQVTLAFDDGIELAFSGKLDNSLMAVVTNVVENIAADGAIPRNLVIDLRDVHATDADADAALEKAQKFARRRGFRVDLRAADPETGDSTCRASQPT